MKRILVLAFAVLLPAGAVDAGEPEATLGVGSQGTLGGFYGAGVVYWRGRVGVAGMVGGLAATNPNQSAVGGSATGYATLVGGGGSRLAVGLRATAFRWAFGEDRYSYLGLELPLRAEVWLGRHFALFSELGFMLQRVSFTGAPTAHVLGTSAPALTTTGFTYYF